MNSNPRIDIDIFGNKRWFNEKGDLHRDGDLPAVEYADGGKSWWKNGKHHREQDNPAIEWANGYKEWWKYGKPLFPEEVEALKRKWSAIRNGDTNLLAEELLNDL